jgi:hypothetical protein
LPDTYLVQIDRPLGISFQSFDLLVVRNMLHLRFGLSVELPFESGHLADGFWS